MQRTSALTSPVTAQHLSGQPFPLPASISAAFPSSDVYRVLNADATQQVAEVYISVSQPPAPAPAVPAATAACATIRDGFKIAARRLGLAAGDMLVLTVGKCSSQTVVLCALRVPQLPMVLPAAAGGDGSTFKAPSSGEQAASPQAAATQRSTPYQQSAAQGGSALYATPGVHGSAAAWSQGAPPQHHPNGQRMAPYGHMQAAAGPQPPGSQWMQPAASPYSGSPAPSWQPASLQQQPGQHAAAAVSPPAAPAGPRGPQPPSLPPPTGWGQLPASSPAGVLAALPPQHRPPAPAWALPPAQDPAGGPPRVQVPQQAPNPNWGHPPVQPPQWGAQTWR